jgi:hypothetical protein
MSRRLLLAPAQEPFLLGPLLIKELDIAQISLVDAPIPTHMQIR